MTGGIICAETMLEGGQGRTLTGPACVLRCYNNLKSSPSGGVYIINLDTHGDVVPWSGFAKLPNDGQIAYESGGTGWIKFRIGAKHGEVAVTSMS